MRRTIEPSEGEHSNLVNDVIPSIRTNSRSFKLVGEDVVELFSHFDDSAGHSGDVGFPFREQVGIVENQ